MSDWESFILKFVQAAAPLAESLFIHNPKSIAIFNASDGLFNGVVDVMTQQQQQPQQPSAPKPQ